MAVGDGQTIIFEPTLDGHGFEEGGWFKLHNGGLIVSVAQEQAVDSYNQSFECSLTMTREQAVQLRDWLIQHFGKP